MKRNTLFLILTILLGAIFRFWFFWADGLHVDEKFTIDLIQGRTIWQVITVSLTTDCNPPLFYIFDWISLNLFGINNFAQRLPSVIFGILLIPAAYYLGKTLKGETLGLLSALAIATLPPLWYYSQFGRAYMLECLLFTIFCIFYIRLIRKDSATKNWVMVAAMAIALAYSHLFSIIPLTLLLGYLIWEYRLKSLKWMGLIFVCSSPLLILFNAIINWRLTARQTTLLDWYGATVPQLIVFSPLEYFGYNFVFWIPMIVYSMWVYRKMKEIPLIVITVLTSFCVLLSVSDVTPVFMRYLLFFVPVLVTIGLLPVSEFIDSPDFSKPQKIFVIGSFAIFYFAIIIFALSSGLYMPKGDITI
jgi:4-amino-4-deoxy-L-arabinose transferase-like glycosyltransferase